MAGPRYRQFESLSLRNRFGTVLWSDYTLALHSASILYRAASTCVPSPDGARVMSDVVFLSLSLSLFALMAFYAIAAQRL